MYLQSFSDLHEDCVLYNVSIGNVVWSLSYFDANTIFSSFFGVQNAQFTIAINDSFHAALPSRSLVLNSSNTGLSSITTYANDTVLPQWLLLDTLSGDLIGVPKQSGNFTLDFSMQGTFSNVRMHISRITIFVSPSVPSAPSATSALSEGALAGIIVGSVVGFAVFLILDALLVHERKRSRKILEELKRVQNASQRRVPKQIKRAHVKILDVLGKGNFGEVCKGLLAEHHHTPGPKSAFLIDHVSFRSSRLFDVFRG